MQAFYEARFEREMGVPRTDFLHHLAGAFEPHPVTFAADGASASVQLATGTARLAWQPRETRAIALIRLPRLHVRFDFSGIEEGERQRVMKRFDLVMLRGGG